MINLKHGRLFVALIVSFLVSFLLPFLVFASGARDVRYNIPGFKFLFIKREVEASDYIIIGKGIQTKQIEENERIYYGDRKLYTICRFQITEEIKGDLDKEIEFYELMRVGYIPKTPNELMWAEEDVPIACQKEGENYMRKVVFLSRFQTGLILKNAWNFSEPNPQNEYYEYGLKHEKIVLNDLRFIKLFLHFHKYFWIYLLSGLFILCFILYSLMKKYKN